jgi:hypothetical protein
MPLFLAWVGDNVIFSCWYTPNYSVVRRAWEIRYPSRPLHFPLITAKGPTLDTFFTRFLLV